MQNEYRTSAFYLAAYLLAQDVPMTHFDREYSGRVEFIFEDAPKRASLVEQFMLGHGATVDAHRFIDAVKRLKSVIHDG